LTCGTFRNPIPFLVEGIVKFERKLW